MAERNLRKFLVQDFTIEKNISLLLLIGLGVAERPLENRR